MLEWRLKAFRHWQTMTEPTWQKAIIRPSIPENHLLLGPQEARDGPKSLDEVDPKLLETYREAGHSVERTRTARRCGGRCVFDSVSVGTTFKEKLAEKGVIFCSFSEAVQEHPDLVRKYLGMVVPYTDNFYATLNSAVFTDGSFCYTPKGCAARWNCPLTSESTRPTLASSNAR